MQRRSVALAAVAVAGLVDASRAHAQTATVTATAAAAPVASTCPTAGLAIGDGALPTGGPETKAGAGADFGAIPEACLGSDAFLRTKGTLLVAADAPDFYGAATVSGGLRIRYALAPRWGISFAADAATFRYTKNAVVASSGVGVGPPSLGGYFALAARPTLAATAFARVLLPLDSARTGLATGAELGGTALALAGRPWFGVDGGATVGVVTTRAAGQTHTALRTNAVAEAFISGPHAAGALGLFARAQPAPALAGISSLGLRAVVRRTLGKTLWLAAASEIPLVGSDRTDLLLTLLLGYTPAPRR